MAKIRIWLHCFFNWVYKTYISIKLNPFTQIVKFLSVCGTIVIFGLLILSIINTREIRSVRSSSEVFENGNLRVGIIYHEFTAPEETSNIEVIVENLGQDLYKDVRIDIVDGEHIWFTQGNEAFFSQIKRGAQEEQTLHYTVSSSLPENIDHLDLRVIVEYTVSDNHLNALLGESSKVVEFSNSPKIRFGPYESLFVALNSVETRNRDELSGLTNFLGAMIALTGAILTLQANFKQIWSWFASKRRDKTISS